MNPKLVERLAEAAHDVWVEGKIRDGWKYGPETDKPNKIHSCLIPYDALSEADKQSDRDLALGIPVILEKAGFTIISKAFWESFKGELASAGIV